MAYDHEQRKKGDKPFDPKSTASVADLFHYPSTGVEIEAEHQSLCLLHDINFQICDFGFC